MPPLPRSMDEASAFLGGLTAHDWDLFWLGLATIGVFVGAVVLVVWLVRSARGGR